jgi:hypothetical protein
MTRVATAVLLAVLSVSGCGGGSDSGPAGVDGSKQISDLSLAEEEALCDWFAGKAGGYGKPKTCAEGFISAPADKAECIADFPDCSVKVSVFESCIEKIMAAQATCTTAALAGAMADADCQTVGAAGCF